MKGIRFYEEYLNKRRDMSERNVIAVLFANGRKDDTWDCIAATDSTVPNSSVHSTTCTGEYLRKYCRRIPEERARQVHPRLFHALKGKS